jgi:hypothetical protein
MTMTARTLVLVAMLPTIGFGCTANERGQQSEAVRSSATRVVGTPASIFRQATTAAAFSTSGADDLAFVTDTGERIAVVPEDLDVTRGWLSATGVARESLRSSFILKGDEKDIYGWVVLRDKNVAYEYTTRGGEVVVQKVPVTDIEPVCDDFDDAGGGDVPDPTPFDTSSAIPHVEGYAMQDTSKLQSKPGATKVLFIDVAPLPLAKDQIYRAWQVVAGTFSAFDVNVTTDQSVFDGTEPRNRGKSCSRAEMGRSSCSLNAFGTSRCCNVYNKGNGHYQGTTFAHELGHLMGLRHDGGGGSGEYFRGLTSFRWCPIMGSSPPKTSWGVNALFQWSKGEYTDSSNKEDDLVIITRNLPYREDDIPDTRPLVVRNGAEVSAADNRGQIARNTDTDTFTFTIGGSGGRAMLTVDRIEYISGGYLDVDAEIQNAAGMTVARGNDMAARTAKLDANLTPGEYKLVVKGGSEGTPANGFSSYSSLGFYGISGTLNAAVGGMGGAGGTPGVDAGRGGAGGAGGRDGGATGGAGGRADAGRAADTAPATGDATNGGTGGTAGGGGAAGAGGGAGAGTGGTSGSGGAAGGAGGTVGGTGGAAPGTGGSPGTAGAGGPTTPPVSGGCSCDVGGGTSSSGAPAPLGAAMLMAALTFARRRRQRRRSAP